MENNKDSKKENKKDDGKLYLYSWLLGGLPFVALVALLKDWISKNK